jgi:hypothetical protein
LPRGGGASLYQDRRADGAAEPGRERVSRDSRPSPPEPPSPLPPSPLRRIYGGGTGATWSGS